MDTLCGIGLPELVIIILLAFVVIGPERTRDLALQVGRWLSRLMRSPWWREFTQITQSLREMPTTLVRMAELEEAQRDLQRTLGDIDRETQFDLNQPGPAAGAPRQPAQKAETDPWGIRSSVANPPPARPEPATPEEDAFDAPPAAPLPPSDSGDEDEQ